MKKSLFVCVLAAAALLASCKDDNKNNGPEVKGTDPSSIAKESLIAYFPFDGNATETIAKLEPTQKGEGVKYGAGRRGQALEGAEKGYLLYDTDMASKMGSFSVALWLKEPQRNDAPVPSFLQFISNDFWGDVCFVTDRRDDGFLAPKWFLRSYEGDAPCGDKWITTDGKVEDEYVWGGAFPADTWSHYIFTYNGETSTFDVFVNGVSVLPEAFDPNCVKFNEGGALGKLNLASRKLLINGWKQKCFEGAEDEWMGWVEGSMDELRIYSKALSADEAKELFAAEVSQVK